MAGISLIISAFCLYFKEINKIKKTMTQKEINDLNIFMSNGEVFISKFLKDKTVSKVRKTITEQEIQTFVMWFVNNKCKELNTNEFIIEVDGKPKYQFKVLE